MAQERLEADKKRTIAEVRAHSLAEIRREQSTTQSELAKIMHVSQGRVSQIEIRPTGQFRTRNAP